MQTQEQQKQQKKLRLFEIEVMNESPPRKQGEQVNQPAITIQDVQIARMIEIDMKFFFFGSETVEGGAVYNYLYHTKGLDIESRYLQHHQTLYIDKVTDRTTGLKKIVTFGTDCLFDEAHNVLEQIYVFKIWNYQSLIAQQYKYDNLTGGTIFQKAYQDNLNRNLAFGNDEEAPYQIPILMNGQMGKPILDPVTAVRFSQDASLAAVVFIKDGISYVCLYRFMDKSGQLIPEKSSRKPIRDFKVELSKKMGNVIDLFIFKTQTNSDDYQINMYLILERGIIYYPSIDKKNDQPIVKMEDTSSTSAGLTLKAGCADFNYITNTLVVDICRKDAQKEEHTLRLFSLEDKKPPVDHIKENEKKCIKYFRNHVVSVEFKPKRPGVVDDGQEAQSQLQIFDLQNGITGYTTQHTRILQVEIEEDAIFYLATGPKNQLLLCKLYEMEDNVKIHHLLKKCLYVDAKNIANDAKFPADIIAEISKDYADWLYKNKKFEESVQQYIETIGHLNPSYVIQKFIQVPQLENLITYLEKLTQTPEKQQSQLSSIADYNKDYTALLLNCYVKKEKFDKIKVYINESTADATRNKRIFDVATAIDVCREHKATREQAIQLATNQKEWSLLVQIYIDDMEKFPEALSIIEDNIKNLREKVEILKVYGPKILKRPQKTASVTNTSSSLEQNLNTRSERLMSHVQLITTNVIKIACKDRDVKEEIKYQPGQLEVKIEELLQIFVDHPSYLLKYLESLIITHGEKVDFKERKLTDINLYHRLLECYLYKNQSLDSDGQGSTQLNLMEKNEIQKKIQEFLKKNDSNGKIDKNYVLFLFQIYGYKEGVKDCCKSLNLRQELLTFYIHHNDYVEVFEWCRNPGVSRSINEEDQSKKDRAQQDADLWIQALTYFRDLRQTKDDTEQVKKSEEYLKKSLEHIGDNNILSPLLVLEILAVKKDLKFEVLSPFLVKKLKDQQRIIKSKQEGEVNKKGEVEKNGIKQMSERIDQMREDIRLMKQQAKNFDQKTCDACNKELVLPSVHFICGHSFHEFCVDGDQIKHCNIHGPVFDEKSRRKEQYNLQAHDSLKFNNELWKKPQKFDTIATYFGQGLFSDLSLQLESLEEIKSTKE